MNRYLVTWLGLIRTRLSIKPKKKVHSQVLVQVFQGKPISVDIRKPRAPDSMDFMGDILSNLPS